ncbi:MAG: 6-carboxytetrahydropterin synthase [Acidobacteria bacterium]|nr:6-carboxytetrahydropterin synthase [Acidobacteriota bacterium]
MTEVGVTARLQFSASHRLHNDDFDDEWNKKVFGKCDNPAGHGHNYTIEVSVKGQVDPVTGMVIDLKDLKDVVRRVIIDEVDHRNLNVDVDFLLGINPTAENLIVAFWNRLSGELDGVRLDEIRLRETENNSVVYRG